MKHYQRLEGMVAATFTPMDARGDINLSVIDKYADLMAESGMAGVFVCGTTGESHSLTTGERKAILAQWIKSARKRFKMIAACGLVTANWKLWSWLGMHKRWKLMLLPLWLPVFLNPLR